MIVEGFVGLLVGLVSALVNALPAAGSHAWISGMDLSAIAVGTSFDQVLPEHELFVAVSVIVPLIWGTVLFNLGVYVYRLVNPFK